MARLVWAFEPLDETGGETGFVEIADDAVAQKLIDQGKAQDGWDAGAEGFRHVDGKAVDAYATRQLKAGGGRGKPPATKAERPEQPDEPDTRPEPRQPDEPPKPDPERRFEREPAKAAAKAAPKPTPKAK
jgi:hypothetical protein